MDCGDNSCSFALERKGMRTNGGCRCLEDFEIHAKQADGWVYKKAPLRRELVRYAQEVRSKLAEARAENERLKVENGRLTDVLLSRHGGEPLTLMDGLDESRARIAELEADVVWAYRELASDDTREFFGMPVDVETDDEARRAVREARNGVS